MKSFFKSLLFCAFLLTPAMAAEKLIYVGLTDTGWQIFLKPLDGSASQQLTKSAGDKRTPVYSAGLGGIVYKGSKGRVWLVTEAGEESLLVDIEGCADFCVDEKDIYFTLFVTGNALRQQLWQAQGEFPTKERRLVFRPNDGSVRQIKFLAGKFLATHMWKPGEERVVWIDPSKNTEREIMRPITNRNKVASYPQWIDSSSGIISVRNEDDTYDLHRIHLHESTTRGALVSEAITNTPSYSEFSSAISATNSLIYAERLSNDDRKWSIVTIDLDTKKVTELDLGRPAKEPSFMLDPSSK